MLQIHQSAEAVEVRLGKAQDESDLAMSYLKQFSDMNVERLVKAHSRDCILYAQKLWTPILRLCQRPWLRRTFIRQEVYAAKSLTVRCGSYMLPWSSYLKGFSVLWLLSTILPDIDDGNDEAAAAIRLVPELRSNSAEPASLALVKPPRNLIDVLATSQEYLVTQKRDTVLAVLGMCGVRISTSRKDLDELGSMLVSPSVTVDYERDLSDIWANVTAYIFAQAALQEPDPEIADALAQSIEASRHVQYWREDVEMGVGDVMHGLAPNIADILNTSNSTHPASSSATSGLEAGFVNPAWSLQWMVTRSAEDIDSLRALQW